MSCNLSVFDWVWEFDLMVARGASRVSESGDVSNYKQPSPINLVNEVKLAIYFPQSAILRIEVMIGQEKEQKKIKFTRNTHRARRAHGL